MSSHGSRERALWFGLVAAPAAWSVALVVTYAIAAHACYPKTVPLSTPIFAGTRVVVGVVIVLAIIVAASAGATALRIWHVARGDGEDRGADARLDRDAGRVRFMAFAGMLMSALFLFLMLLNGVSLIIVSPCTYGA